MMTRLKFTTMSAIKATKVRGQNLGPIKHAYSKPMKNPRGRENAGGHIAPVVQIPQRTDLAAKFLEVKGSNEA
jgi:hypothetical protein